MKYNFVFVEILTKKNEIKFIPAIKLKEYENQTLVATFKHSHTPNNYYNTYKLSKEKHPKLSFTLEFNGIILLVNKDKVMKSNLGISFTEEDMQRFLNNLGLLDLKAMKEEEFKAFTDFASKYNKNIVKKGAVIPIIKDISGVLYTYYIEEILEDGLICVPISYNAQTGLKVKSYEREFISYNVYITGVYYLELQEKKIKEMLGESSLKLK